MSGPNEHETRILILAPTGRDAFLIAETLASDGLSQGICPDAETLLKSLGVGAAAAIILDEALRPDAVADVGRWVSVQAPWSDMPFVVLTSRGAPRPSTTKRG